MLDEDNTIPLATQVILIMDIAECSAGCASVRTTSFASHTIVP